ncbi:MAG TPA: ATP-binding protein [Candidatus Sulfobium mesophilum]|nr:ATP-binding protein [Candidatus Sulfobium mesophilum]
MDGLLKELRSLNKTLQKFADAMLPSQDGLVLDAFRAFHAYSCRDVLLLKGIRNPDPVRFHELKGIDAIIQGLKANTGQFLEGLPCNNVLLYGPRGTGKSSAVKAVFNTYAARGLRMIEMQRDTLIHMLEVADLVKKRREKFIIYCDDLSFEEDEKSYRQIKTVLEGGLETRPANMLIYATSNRRHLMPEKAVDNLPVLSDGELHPAESIEEKLSLSDRFGLRFGFPHFDTDTYLAIVDNYAHLKKIRTPRRELKERAMQWALSHGSYSGRSARQFIDDLEGKIGRLKLPISAKTTKKVSDPKQ